MLGKLAGTLQDAGALAAPCSVDRIEDLDKARPSVACFARKIGSAPERLGIGGQEHRQRPSALFAHAGKCGHVDLVDFRPFFAVDLDVDEEPVHDLRDFGIFEAFMGHDMAPVACCITDRKQDRPIEPCRFGQCGRRPRAPVHRVVAMLAKVWAAFVSKQVFLRKHVAVPKTVI
ncbi:hypothetical protein HNQ96_001800 [Aminobacter lissarensis]|uniref:Uncharacterized protein n=1 Tax=Aminobacter carboxidus TaxID=376165 RepID=A0A8E1WEI1_9HYPH|nr:hypothetical protein [Aminobacter lissarensis]